MVIYERLSWRMQIADYGDDWVYFNHGLLGCCQLRVVEAVEYATGIAFFFFILVAMLARTCIHWQPGRFLGGDVTPSCRLGLRRPRRVLNGLRRL